MPEMRGTRVTTIPSRNNKYPYSRTALTKIGPALRPIMATNAANLRIA
jgi:hypothetical protein